MVKSIISNMIEAEKEIKKCETDIYKHTGRSLSSCINKLKHASNAQRDAFYEFYLFIKYYDRINELYFTKKTAKYRTIVYNHHKELRNTLYAIMGGC